VKTGAGTLTLTGNQSANAGGIRLGTQGAVPAEGGTLVVSADNALGAATLQFNSGSLNASGTRSFANAISVGGRNNGVSAPTFSGSDTTFTGTGNGFFRATGTTGELALNVNNTTTFNGSWIATSGAGSTTGITLGGTGKLVLAGDASLVAETWTLANSATLAVNNALGGGVTVASGTTLQGGGTIAGATTIQSGGFLAPGNSPGVLTFGGNLTLAGTTTMEFLGTTRGNPTTGYDGIDLTGTNANTLTYGGTLSLLFNAPLTAGVYDLFAIGSVNETGTFGNVSIGGSAVGSSGGLNITGTDWTANLTDTLASTWSLSFNNASGDLTIAAIPEPSTYAALAGLGMLGFAFYRRRRQKAAKLAA
jgi:hypothetical protein